MNHGRWFTLKLPYSLLSTQTCFHEMRNLDLHDLVAIATQLTMSPCLSWFITNNCRSALALASPSKPG
jgi:hypothetical protein